MIPKTPGYRVLVKPDTLADYDPTFAAAKRMGLELLPTEERKELVAVDTGVVVQLGPTAFEDRGGKDAWCKKGDRISYARHGGKMIRDPDNAENSYLVLNDEDVIMVWEFEQ